MRVRLEYHGEQVSVRNFISKNEFIELEILPRRKEQIYFRCENSTYSYHFEVKRVEHAIWNNNTTICTIVLFLVSAISTG